MKPIKIGLYELGWEKVELYGREGTGGEYWSLKDGCKCPQVFIGIDYNKWTDVLCVLLHESTEFIMMRNNHRFNPSQDLSQDHAQYLFVMNHTEFSHVTACVADFINQCQRDFFKEWKKYLKGKK